MTRRKDSEAAPKVIRAELSARLRKQSAEIEGKIVTRIRNLSEPVGDEDPTYLEGLLSAVSEALSYGIECIEKGESWSAPIPPGVTRQARRSARDGVRLDMVLRRYAAGNKVLEEFIVAEAGDIPREILCQILSDQGPQVDRLMESVAAEYTHEMEQTKRSSAQREADRVLQLLKSNSLASPPDFEYDFDGWHVGMIVVGPNAELACAFAEILRYRSLLVARDDETTWVWIGSSKQPAAIDLERFVIDKMPSEISVAIGEPRKRLDGWRQTHYEAQIALQVMLYQRRRVTRCRDVILTSAVMRDQSLAISLTETYLAPLDGRGDSGEVLRTTLRAYFEADQNAASAAMALGIDRRTVERRLRRVEARLGQPLRTCNAQLQVALSAEELVSVSSPIRQFSDA